MLDAAFPSSLVARPARTRWALVAIAGLVAVSAAAPLAAAPRKRGKSSAVRIRPAAAKHKPAPAPAAVAHGGLVSSGGALTLDQQITLYERSANFWERSGVSVEGCDSTTAVVLSLACREQALDLMLRKARAEGRPGEASRFAREKRQARNKWAVRSTPKSQTSAGGAGGMMGGPGMPGMDMGAGMPGGPGMGGPGMPGMGGPEMGMGSGPPGMGGPGMMGGPPR